jgi:hypothetical protein
VSPKQRILFASGLFASFGVSVSIILIAIGGGFSAPISSLFHPPTPADVWTVGENIREGTILKYSLTTIGNHSSPWSSLGGPSSLINATVVMSFHEDHENKWNVTFRITNATTTKVGAILLSKQQLTNAGPIGKDFLPFYIPIESSLLEIRDIALQPEYLAIGAEWNSIDVGLSTISARIVTQEKIQTQAGIFDAFVLSYKIGDKTSRIWLAKDFPLPLKAEVYNAHNQLQYNYSLFYVKQ